MNWTIIVAISVPALTGLFVVATKTPNFYEKLTNRLFFVIWIVCAGISLFVMAVNLTVDQVLPLIPESNHKSVGDLKFSTIYENLVILIPIPSMIIIWIIGYIGSNLHTANIAVDKK